MANLQTVVHQLRKERDAASKTVHRLNAALAALSGTSQSNGSRGRLSAAARAKIAAAQRARWAKLRSAGQKQNGGQKPNIVSMPKKKHTMSAAARKKIAAAQRARWAKLKSAQKKSA
jgi:hypothetical protein